MKKLSLSLFLFILLLFSCTRKNDLSTSSELEFELERPDFIKLQISSRVDTTNTEVKAILELYENYLNSKPDSIYDNPYWNEQEKLHFKDFDFSRVSIYNGLNSQQLFSIYDPFVLSVEPIGEKYQIRVLYSNSATEPPYVGSKVWCIHKLNAIKEVGVWKLENVLIEHTKSWEVRELDFLKYVFPSDHSFDQKKASRAKQFCEDIINRYNPKFKDSFKFYLASDVDEMGMLENFDYYFSGITSGKAREGMILSSKGDEFYPHEFVHQTLPVNEERGIAIEEGLATFLGTKQNIGEYLTLMKKLATDFERKDSFTMENILNNSTAWTGYSVVYPGGAVVCEVIFERKGDEGIKKLALGKTRTYNEIISLSEEILELNMDEVIKLFEDKIMEYK